MQIRRLATFLAGCLVTLSVAAEMQYWVSVGSYKQAQDAERARDEASQKMAESFAVIGTDTAKGYFYRVAAGPYLTSDLAQDRLVSAKASGFANAWLWSDDVDPLDISYSFGSDDDNYSLDLPEYSIDINTSDENAPGSGGTTQGYDESLYDESIEEADLIQRRKGPPEVVDEAPPGYKLNKMRRDASIVPLAPYSGALEVNEQGPPPSPTQANTFQPTLTLNPSNPIPLASYHESELSMKIDGRLDEAVWQQFPGVDQFRVVDPDTGEIPKHHTLVKMFYSERGLYASFQMEQPPESLVRVYSVRDKGWLNRDNVGITIDTSGEGRYGYWINLALGGNQVDGTVLPERQFSGDWDGAWYGGTEMTDKGWNAEIFLPWSQMAMPKEAGRRTLNAYASRKVAYRNERYAVPALPFTQPLFMSALQPLVLEDVDPRQQWSFYPYASMTLDEVAGETRAQAGADLFWRPSTNMQLTASLNPDFGNVESDDVIVNLSAFEVFFPERRLFFQEGIEIFNTTPRAKGGNPVTVVNTRRIGGKPSSPTVPDDVDVPASELKQPSELMGALKVVGQLNKIRYGFLTAFEDDTKFDVGALNYHQDGRDFGAARFLYEDKTRVGAYRALGVISTLVAHPEEDATVHGVDYHYLTASGKWKLDGQLLRSDIDSQGVGYGGFVDVGYTWRQGLNFRWGLSHFDDKLDLNDFGFNRRNDATNTTINMDYTRSDLSWAHKAYVNGFAEYEVNGEGYKTRKSLGARLELSMLNQDRIRMGMAYFPQRAKDRDSRDNGTFTVEGQHAFSFDYFTDTAARLSYRFGFNHDGEELGGARLQSRVGVTWRPVDHINIGALAQYHKREGWLLWQEDRNFTTFDTHEWRPRLNFDYFLTAKQQIRLSAQWVGIKAEEQAFYLVPERVGELQQIDKPDAELDDFGISSLNLQLRYRWEIAPLSELSVVYTLNGSQRLSADSGSFENLASDAYDDPAGEQLIVKLRYRLGT